MNKDELSKNYWMIANAIVVFVTLQEIAFSTLYIQRNEPLPGLKGPLRKTVAAILLGVAFVAYMYAAWWCGNQSRNLSDETSEVKDTMRNINTGRVIFIAYIGAVTILGVFWDLLQ